MVGSVDFLPSELIETLTKVQEVGKKGSEWKTALLVRFFLFLKVKLSFLHLIFFF